MRTLILFLLLIMLGWVSLPLLKQHLPPQFKPLTPLSVTDPPDWMTQIKIKRLTSDPEKCRAAMRLAQQPGWVSFSERPDVTGNCPLSDPLRIQKFGPISLCSNFLTSCPMAIASSMFALRSREQIARDMHSPLVRITHIGSYACRNIYHRTQGRPNVYADADAWDVTGFQLIDGHRFEVSRHWQQRKKKRHCSIRCGVVAMRYSTMYWARTTMLRTPHLFIWLCEAQATADKLPGRISTVFD